MVANLVEFKVGEGCFKWIKECCEEVEEEEKYEEVRATFGTAYLRNHWADSFQIWVMRL